jgi:hypothetical protein
MQQYIFITNESSSERNNKFDATFFNYFNLLGKCIYIYTEKNTEILLEDRKTVV